MRDIALHVAGALAIFIAIVHSVLGETRVFSGARIEPQRTRLLLRLVWQAGAAAWLGGGILLFAAPFMDSDSARQWIVYVFGAVFAVCAVLNAIASRGRHFGWMVLAAITVLALIGV